MKHVYLLIAACLCVVSSLLAQRIENVRAEVTADGERVVITYDIAAASENQRFKVSIYGSHNNFATPLSMITGDAGTGREITGGTGKRVEWSAKSELKEFKGDVTFEVRADIVPAAGLYFQNPVAGGSFRRGKSIDITWAGGAPGESLRIDLMKGGTVISQVASIQNNQRYTWVVPSSSSKGKNYQLRITSGSGVATSGNFGIKSKVPLGLKLLPVVAVGGVAALLLSGGGDKGPSNLPEPPSPEN
ncbi:MAG: Ser-Thr-rich GPI-anchored membrane family protein [Bacteroidota bacterium]